METTVTFAAALGALLTLGACGIEPETPTFDAELNESTLPALDEGGLVDPERAAARISGQLEFLFGSLREPGFYVLDEWQEELRDPSDAWWELSDRAVDAVREDNAVRFGGAARGSRALGRYRDAASRRAAARPRHAMGALAVRIRRVDRGRRCARGDPSRLSEPGRSQRGTILRSPGATKPVAFWSSYYPVLEESAELYRVRCLTCHDPMGGGNGPTGLWLDPAPRDLRDGIFKWTSVQANYRPRRGDLIELLERGVRGTGMPSFRRYSRGELEGLVDWVRYLAIRGETEQLATYFAVNSGEVRAGDVMKAYETTWKRWDDAVDFGADAPDLAPRPDAARADRIARGAELFRGDLANCATCHGREGKGDGDAIWEIADN